MRTEHCPRCAGRLISSYGETFCMACSWRPATDRDRELAEAIVLAEQGKGGQRVAAPSIDR